MSGYRAPLEDLHFILKDVFKAEQFWASFPETSEINDDLANAILDEGAKLCEQTLLPLFRSGDEEGCKYSASINEYAKVECPEGFAEAFKTYAEGGWVGLAGDPLYGGQGLPKTLTVLFEEMVYSANTAFALYPTLTSGASLLISRHANESLKKLYLPKLYSGQWAGTMCLTEPHAGTDLGLIKTKAEATGESLNDEAYAISGTKIFITGGEQDLTENIIHLVLARLPDAPSGPKGISLFLVPKFLLNEQGELGERNKVSCGSIEKKMGIKGASTCVMNFDGAKGFLVGEPNRGLMAMFTMMNYERLSIGIQGLAAGEAAYQRALAYAKDRLQGRGSPSLSSKTESSRNKTADPIIVHGDVRRMLLTMKAYNEGGRAFCSYVARQLDTAHYGQEEAKKRAADLVALLTPVAKAFFTDKGFEACVQGQQVFGGHGYIREWGMEQLVRDARITQIYEGTNGIQALDLLGRKIVFSGGELLVPFVEDVNTFLEESENIEHLGDANKVLKSALEELQAVTQWVIDKARSDENLVNSVAVAYLNLFGHVAYGFMWGMMVKAALEKDPKLETPFCSSKIKTASFYNTHLMVKITSLKQEILAGSQALFDFGDGEF